MPVEGRGLGSRRVLEVAKRRRLGQPYRTPIVCESCERFRMPKRRENLDGGAGSRCRHAVVASPVLSAGVDRSPLGFHGPSGRSSSAFTTFRVRRQDILSEGRMR